LQATGLRPEIDCANYEMRQHKDKRGFDLISDALPFGRLVVRRTGRSHNAVGDAQFRSRLYHAVIRVYDEAGNVIETHELPAYRIQSACCGRALCYKNAATALYAMLRPQNGGYDYGFVVVVVVSVSFFS